MFFRRSASADRWLQAKIWLFVAGAVLALTGMALERDALIGAAAVLLLAGVALRFAGGDSIEAPPPDGPDVPDRGGTEAGIDPEDVPREPPAVS